MSSLYHLAIRITDAILPHHCVLCRTLTDETSLCADCWAGLAPITEPVCHHCGRPLPHATPQMRCGMCFVAPPPITRLRSLYHYNDTSRALVLKFKHGDGLFLAPFFARMFGRILAPVSMPNQLIIPIPLHRRRYFQRRFNQSAEIARLLGDGPDKGRFFPDGLIRVKPTISQGRLNKADRKRNLAGAFHVPPAHRPAIKQRPILLVDDVFTTGATLFEAARTLSKSGSGPVSAIVIARVLRLGGG